MMATQRGADPMVTDGQHPCANGNGLASHIVSSSTEGSNIMEKQHSATLLQQASSDLDIKQDERSVSQVLNFINMHKLAANRPVVQSGTTSSVKSSTSSTSSSQPKWIQPSGPRKPGEGTENEEQGIVSAQRTATGAVVLRITLLAAGFIIGPTGASVREIMRQTDCDIKSWTETSNSRSRRPCRVFVLEGEEPNVVAALRIVTAAVDHYKALCEGAYSGQTVARAQRIMGVEFSYQPPPKNVVPFAASLKGHVQRVGKAPVGGDATLLRQQQAAMMVPGLLPMMSSNNYMLPMQYMVPASPTSPTNPFMAFPPGIPAGAPASPPGMPVAGAGAAASATNAAAAAALLGGQYNLDAMLPFMPFMMVPPSPVRYPPVMDPMALGSPPVAPASLLSSAESLNEYFSKSTAGQGSNRGTGRPMPGAAVPTTLLSNYDGAPAMYPYPPSGFQPLMGGWYAPASPPNINMYYPPPGSPYTPMHGPPMGVPEPDGRGAHHMPMSPSRLNPLAQAWRGPMGRDMTPAEEEAMRQRQRQDRDKDAYMAGRPNSRVSGDGSGFDRMGMERRFDEAAGIRRNPSAGSYQSSTEEEMLLHSRQSGPMDLANKTPKRPTAAGQAQSARYSGAANMSHFDMDISPNKYLQQYGYHEHQASAGGGGGSGSGRSTMTSSSQASGYTIADAGGRGSGASRASEGTGESPVMVSPGDPTVSPRRFAGGRGRRGARGGISAGTEGARRQLMHLPQIFNRINVTDSQLDHSPAGEEEHRH